MFRFDAKKGYYLYPEAGDLNDLHLNLNQGITYEGKVQPRLDIEIVKHGLQIPSDARNYEEFVGKIKANEQAFVKKLDL